MEAPELADVVLVVEGERFPAHRNVLAALSEYFRGLLLSGMQEGSGQQEIPLEEVSAGAFRVVLRYLYTAAVPAWEELQGTGTGAKGGGAAVGAVRRLPACLLTFPLASRPGAPLTWLRSAGADWCAGRRRGCLRAAGAAAAAA